MIGTRKNKALAQELAALRSHLRHKERLLADALSLLFFFFFLLGGPGGTDMCFHARQKKKRVELLGGAALKVLDRILLQVCWGSLNERFGKEPCASSLFSVIQSHFPLSFFFICASNKTLSLKLFFPLSHFPQVPLLFNL